MPEAEKDKQGPSPRRITSLAVRNFRAFESQRVECAPLTILVGPNNAGKSSILSAVRILAQTAQSADWEVPLLLGEFGTFRDIVFGNRGTRTLGASLGFEAGGTRASFDVDFRYRAQRREIVLRAFRLYRDGRLMLETVFSKDSGRQLVRRILELPREVTKSITKPLRMFHFLPRAVLPVKWELDRLKRKKRIALSYAKHLYEIDRLSRQAIHLLQSVQYIGPFRDAPARLCPISGEHPSALGPTGRGTMDLLVADYFRRGTQKQVLSGAVQEWLGAAQVASDLQIHAISDRHCEIRVQHPKTGEFENLADVGYGVSQILPVLVGGYNLNPGSVFIVEQPEIHLHPAAQSQLGDFFLHLYRNGVQCLVETHSEHLILRLQRHVALGSIPPGDVSVNFVRPGATSKELIRMPLGEDGIFQTEWPQGFFAERLDEALELARAPLRRRGQIG